jgi:hypothetical protein
MCVGYWYHWVNAAILSLGYAYPCGYASRSQGVRKQIKGGTQKDYKGRILYLWVPKGGTILIWGYAKGYNFDLWVLEYQKVENHWVNVISLSRCQSDPIKWRPLYRCFVSLFLFPFHFILCLILT